jgi:DedD protein
MAFFKFRLPGQGAEQPQGNANPTPAESVEAMRRRARHRLIGASVLVVLGVVGFPMLFDTQPRPVSVDIAIDIPDRANSKPLVEAPVAKPLATAAALDPKEEVVDSKPATNKSEAKPEVKAEAAVAAVAPKEMPKPEVKAETKPETKPEAKPEVKAETKTDTKAEAKTTDKASAARFVVQVGTFSDDSKVKEVRLKLEKAGIQTYTQVIDSKDGHRTRVRVSPPSSTRDDADKVARKIKQLSLQPQVLTL